MDRIVIQLVEIDGSSDGVKDVKVGMCGVQISRWIESVTVGWILYETFASLVNTSFRLGLLYEVIVARSEISPLYSCIVILLWGCDARACPACGSDKWEHLTVSLLVRVVFVVC